MTFKDGPHHFNQDGMQAYFVALRNAVQGRVSIQYAVQLLLLVQLTSCCSGRVYSQYPTMRCTSQREGCIACMSL